MTFATTELDPDLTDCFQHFDHHPETAAMLYYLNSGIDQFSALDSMWKNNSDGAESDPGVVKKVVDEILDEKLSDAEKEGILDSFLSAYGRGKEGVVREFEGLPHSIDAHHFACGTCGIQSINGQNGRACRKVMLKDLPKSLELSKEQQQWHDKIKEAKPLRLPINEAGDLKDFDLVQLCSLHESRKLKEVFHLHPGRKQ